VAGRLYRASYRHMAHFTLLLILFAAAAYKSEVGSSLVGSHLVRSSRAHGW